MTTPADELRAAAQTLRDLAARAIHEDCPHWTTGHTLGAALADWLTAASEDTDADHFASCRPDTCVRLGALAVARQILGSQP